MQAAIKKALMNAHPHTNVEPTVQGIIPGPVWPEEEGLQSHSWPRDMGVDMCPACQELSPVVNGGCGRCGTDIYDSPEQYLEVKGQQAA